MIYIQIIGFIAFVFLVLSFYFKNVKTLLIYQIISNVTYSIHYVLLGGYSGALLCLFSTLRNLLAFNLKHSRLKFVILSMCYILIGFFTFDSIISILPVLAMIIYTYAIFFRPNNLKEGSMFASVFWITYNGCIFSYVGMVTETILLISNFILVLRDKYGKRKVKISTK